MDGTSKGCTHSHADTVYCARRAHSHVQWCDMYSSAGMIGWRWAHGGQGHQAFTKMWSTVYGLSSGNKLIRHGKTWIGRAMSCEHITCSAQRDSTLGQDVIMS